MSHAIEIDGPPMAYFEVSSDPVDLDQFVVRLTYRSMRVHGNTEERVREWMIATLAEIRTWCFDHDAFIIWRRHPIVEYHPTSQLIRKINRDVEEVIEVPAHWEGYARLVTSIPLPPDMWERFETRQGEPARQLASL